MVWMPLLMLPSALWYRRTPAFTVSYLAVWVALALVALRMPWMSVGAYAAVVGGVYELTPQKRRFLDRCRAEQGLRHGLDCAGSSAGLMVAFFGLGLMSVWWMAVVATVVFAQKVAPFGARLVLPVGLALVVVGLIAIAA
jgi:predicted metal-binding membrane protein